MPSIRPQDSRQFWFKSVKCHPHGGPFVVTSSSMGFPMCPKMIGINCAKGCGTLLKWKKSVSILLMLSTWQTFAIMEPDGANARAFLCGMPNLAAPCLSLVRGARVFAASPRNPILCWKAETQKVNNCGHICPSLTHECLRNEPPHGWLTLSKFSNQINSF